MCYKVSYSFKIEFSLFLIYAYVKIYVIMIYTYNSFRKILNKLLINVENSMRSIK